MADVLGVLRSTYGEYERGVIFPPSDKIKTLADYFGVTTDYLLEASSESETIDLLESFKTILNYLDDASTPLLFAERTVSTKERRALIQGIESCLNTISIIREKNL